MLKRVGRRGDTLVEVTLAIGILSMIAISIAAVMTSSTSGAQTALETTLTREEIDTQAEALRYIQTAYAVNANDTENNKYQALWKKITDNAIDLSGLTDTEKKEILTYSPTTCDIPPYNDNVDDKVAKVISDHAFVINPRALGLQIGDEVNQIKDKDDYVNAVYIPRISHDGTSVSLTEASIYPRLIYGTDALNNDDSGTGRGLLNSVSTNLWRAEGIYVIAVKDAKTTQLANEATIGDTSAFYDFYIRSCWYGTNANEASSIATVIRLYDSDAIAAAQTGHVTANFIIGKDGAIPSSISSMHNRKRIQLPALEKYGYTFVGWCDGDVVRNNDGKDTCLGSKTYPAGYTLKSEHSDGDEVYTLTDVWERVKYTINYSTPWDASNVGSTVCYLETNPNGCQVSSTVPTRAGYTFSKWCTASSSDTTSCSGTSYASNSTIPYSSTTFPTSRTITLYAVWNKKYIQDYSVATCRSEASSTSQTLFDKRDNNTYTVRYANNQCWMTQDLRISGTVASRDSNFSNTSSWNLRPTSDIIRTYTQANSYTYGYYYNFCAATAGNNNGCTQAGEYSGTSDICPANWRMPNGTEIDNMKGNRNVFSLSDSYDGNGWWSTTQTSGFATDDGSKLQRALIRKGNDFKFNPDWGWGTSANDGGYFRTNRMKIRCVHK